jgi:hypothetical protein
MSLLPRLRALPNAAAGLAKLIAAALVDEDGKALDQAIAALNPSEDFLPGSLKPDRN